MSEDPNVADTPVDIHQQWLNLMGIQIGDEVMIVASGLGAGSGFQGYLVTLVITQHGLSAVVIREHPETGTNVVVNWENITMISKAKAPKETSMPEPLDIDEETIAMFTRAMDSPAESVATEA